MTFIVDQQFIHQHYKIFYSSQGGLYSNQRRPDKNNLLQLQKEAIKVLNDEKNLKIKKDQLEKFCLKLYQNVKRLTNN